MTTIYMPYQSWLYVQFQCYFELLPSIFHSFMSQGCPIQAYCLFFYQYENILNLHQYRLQFKIVPFLSNHFITHDFVYNFQMFLLWLVHKSAYQAYNKVYVLYGINKLIFLMIFFFVYGDISRSPPLSSLSLIFRSIGLSSNLTQLLQFD